MATTAQPDHQSPDTSKWNTPQIRDALRRRYREGAHAGVGGAPNFALLEEVADATGAATRYCDAIGMELWRSNGYLWHGFEIKASRSDWLNERKDPTKAHAFKRYVDRWWLVVGDTKIVRDGELPPDWGLLVPRGDQLVVKVQAPALVPEPMPRSFLAALMRRVVEQSADTKALETAKAEGVALGWAKALAADSQAEHGRHALRYILQTAQFIIDDTLGGRWPKSRAPDKVDAEYWERRIKELKQRARDVVRILTPALDGSDGTSSTSETTGTTAHNSQTLSNETAAEHEAAAD